ncbi:hypothetical protein F511_25384 [Dorcoceras hygrometricum]|uniref:Uncharacterized protein n=1 Tax=Dorcoceras hygrometricum TaxID=472368 RepID=A0A2Z7CZS2_9LAMI|nr:hypothetical protein F511_25384 [Dorcoceras hygrometricum]
MQHLNGLDEMVVACMMAAVCLLPTCAYTHLHLFPDFAAIVVLLLMFYATRMRSLLGLVSPYAPSGPVEATTVHRLGNGRLCFDASGYTAGRGAGPAGAFGAILDVFVFLRFLSKSWFCELAAGRWQNQSKRVLERRLERKRRRLDVATDCPAARDLFVTVACCWYLASAAIRFDEVSGATSFELVATLRFEVATGTSREKRCIVLFLRLDTQLLHCWRISSWFLRLLVSWYLLVWEIDGVDWLLPESSGFPCDNQRVLTIAQKYKHLNGLDEMVVACMMAAVCLLPACAYTHLHLFPAFAAIVVLLLLFYATRMRSLLGLVSPYAPSGPVEATTVHRLGNGRLCFDASGYTAGRGAGPAGGAPGGG